ncbi:MAG: hypothetical protein F6K36_06945 [Symploca sp. SIO3C6]|uniref:Uncharacterized protein n=1 Tax=Symploca sp. SIO1C4 TaxID=2607765 RepID=A0A6B3NJ41_9CYAN|nr:hypothetical protein [Symploca sp. SIO3C6]NER30542.1 hypothetical protein [Symploca sp. SIO1C4]
MVSGLKIQTAAVYLACIKHLLKPDLLLMHQLIKASIKADSSVHTGFDFVVRCHRNLDE